MEELVFKNDKEEISYWKSKANENFTKFEDERIEFEEFQSSSKELEIELETNIKQLEKELHEHKVLNEKYCAELQNLRSRVETDGSRVNSQFTRLEDELEKATDENLKLKEYVRSLEQQNDDFERAQRIAAVSLEDFELKLNCAIERNALLENELDDKQDLQITIQRLKDEARDLQQELAARQRINRTTKSSISESQRQQSINEYPPNFVSSSSDVAVSSTNDNVSISNSSKDHQTVLRSPSQLQEGGLSPIVRITALNIVGDLLTKVGHLEGKLSSLNQSYVDANGDAFNFASYQSKNAFNITNKMT